MSSTFEIQFIHNSKNQASIFCPNCLILNDEEQESVYFMNHAVDFLRQMSDTQAIP